MVRQKNFESKAERQFEKAPEKMILRSSQENKVKEREAYSRLARFGYCNLIIKGILTFITFAGWCGLP